VPGLKAGYQPLVTALLRRRDVQLTAIEDVARFAAAVSTVGGSALIAEHM
jgi:hypothetical protein